MPLAAVLVVVISGAPPEVVTLLARPVVLDGSGDRVAALTGADDRGARLPGSHDRPVPLVTV
jgi:hypothetical protein